MKNSNIPTLIHNIAVEKRCTDDLETSNANDFFLEYLHNATKSAHIIETMSDIIGEFQRRAPRLIVTKCIDGRTHGSKGKGYPPTTVTFSRTEGNIVDLKAGNHLFWKRINKVVSQAMHDSDGKPALFIALGHYGEKGHGCAAHSLDNDKALATVAHQAEKVRESYDKSQLYAIHGMTNTDDMAERLIFPNAIEIDTAEIIKKFSGSEKALTSPADVFQSGFLETRLDDSISDAYVGGQTPQALLDGDSARMYNDLQTALAMEAYLLREISQSVTNERNVQTIVNPDLFNHLLEILNSVTDLPTSLKPALLYQTVWNIAYTLYQRNRLEHMNAEERERQLEHNEDLIGYGEGFELLPRNEIILVKIGRGDDAEALAVARKVLLKNRDGNKKSQKHPPLLHANVEVANALNTWDALNTDVIAPLRTMLRTIREVFGDEARILTSYSYADRKIFFPVQTKTATEMEKVATHAFSTVAMTTYPIDVINELTARNFKERGELDHREKAYIGMILQESSQ